MKCARSEFAEPNLKNHTPVCSCTYSAIKEFSACYIKLQTSIHLLSQNHLDHYFQLLSFSHISTNRHSSKPLIYFYSGNLLTVYFFLRIAIFLKIVEY